MSRLPVVALVLLGVHSWPCSGGSESAPQPECARIEYIAHAAFRLTSPDGARLVIDPFASRIWLGYDFPQDLAADLILITHPHFDHDAGRYRGEPSAFLTGKRIIDTPGEYTVGDIHIVGIKGRHAEPWGREFGQLNTIFVVEAGGIRVAHFGDNEVPDSSVVAALGAVDVLMLPVDSEFHILGAAEIDQILELVKPHVLIPMHYRIPELEPSPESPSDLGTIEPWLETRSLVRNEPKASIRLCRDELPPAGTVLRLRSSLTLAAPGVER